MLIRLKAPLVFGIAATLLALSWLWVAGTEWSGRRQLAAATRVPGAAARAALPLPALPDVNRLLALSAGAAMTGNVFHSVTIDRFIERREVQRKAEEAARRKAEMDAEAQRKAKAAAAAAVAAANALRASAPGTGTDAKSAVKEPPPKRIYALTYNGLVTTPDRQNVGIVGIVLPGTPGRGISLAVAPGDACLDAAVTGLTRESVTLQLKEGKAVVLEAGKTQRFEEPALHGP